MKKIITIIALCMTVQSSYALPLGNPSDASLFYHEIDENCYAYYDVITLGLGFYGDYVFERHMKTKTGHNIDETSLYTNALYLVTSFYERLDLFATVGATNFCFNSIFFPFNGPALDPFPRFEFESGPSFSWSIGSRASLWECGSFILGAEAQYFTSNSSLKRFTIASGASLYLDQDHARYWEWQLGLGLSYRTEFFIPYIGIKYAHAFWDFNDQLITFVNNSAILHNLKNQKNWGYAVGVTYSPPECERISLSVEGRFADERALYINGQIRF